MTELENHLLIMIQKYTHQNNGHIHFLMDILTRHDSGLSDEARAEIDSWRTYMQEADI